MIDFELLESCFAEAALGNRLPLVYFAHQMRHSEFLDENSKNFFFEKAESLMGDCPLSTKIDVLLLFESFNRKWVNSLALKYLKEVDELVGANSYVIGQSLFSIGNVYRIANHLGSGSQNLIENMDVSRLLVVDPVSGLMKYFRLNDGIVPNYAAFPFSVMRCKRCCSNVSFEAEVLFDCDRFFSPASFNSNENSSFFNLVDRANDGGFSHDECLAFSGYIEANYEKYSIAQRASILFFLGKISPEVAARLAFKYLNFHYSLTVDSVRCLKVILKMIDRVSEEKSNTNFQDLNCCILASYYLLNPEEKKRGIKKSKKYIAHSAATSSFVDDFARLSDGFSVA